MNVNPRIRSASETNPGVECCSANDVKLRCQKCQDHAEKRTLRSAADYTPPDPYKLRPAPTPDDDPRHKANPMVPPDGYAIALAREAREKASRKENR